jgi:O-antigen/teichoic acid export membrane protein
LGQIIFIDLGVIKRQAFQSSVLLYFGTLIGFLTTGLIAPNVLSKSEIGTLRLLLSYSAIFMSLSILGFSTVTIRFLHQFQDKITKKYNGFLGIALIVVTIGFLITWILIEVIEPSIVQNNIEKSPQFAKYFFLIIPLTIFQTYYALFDAYNNALYRSSYGVFLRDFVQRLLILSGLSLLFFKVFDFADYVYYYVLSICVPTVLILLHIIRHKSFDIKINTSFLRRTMLGSMMSVSLFGLLNSMSNIAALQIDAIMINMYLDDAAVGVYVTTFYFGTLVFIPSKALNKIAPSLIARAFKEDDQQTVKDIYYRSCANLFLIGALVFLGLLVNLDNVFNIIPSTYEEGKLVVVLIGLANLVKMAGGSNDSLITYSRYFKVTTLFLSVFAILIIVLNYVFIPAFGIVGAAFATLLSIFVHNLTKYVFIRIKFGYNPYNYQYLFVLMISAGIYAILFMIPDPENFILDIFMDSALAVVLFYVSVRKLRISGDLIEMARPMMAKAWHFFRKR